MRASKQPTRKCCPVTAIRLLLGMGIFCSSLFVGALAEPTGMAKTAADYNDWTYHGKVKINTTKSGGAGTTEDLTDFPLLIRLDETNFDFSLANADGSDIRFAQADGTTPIAYEIEEWDVDAHRAAIWVLVPTVYGDSVGQYIIMHFGNANATTSQSDPSAVFSSGNFMGVWHLDETQGGTGTSGVYKDATDNGYDGDDYVSTTDALGVAGRAQDLRSGNEYIEIPGLPDTAPAQITVSIWAKVENQSGEGYFISKNGQSTTPGFALTRKPAFYATVGGTKKSAQPWWSGLASGVWTHLAGTFDGSLLRLYLDGDTVSSTSVSGSIGSTGTNSLRIGINSNALNSAINGVVDEVRVSGTARSPDWIKLCHANQEPTSSIISFEGVPKPVSPGPLDYLYAAAVHNVGETITDNRCSNGGGTAESYSITPSLPQGLSLDTKTGTISGTPQAESPQTTYTVTATNAAGQASTQIVITVNSATKKPGPLQYSYNPVSYVKGVAIPTNRCTNNGGAADSFTVIPDLPDGLQLDGATGNITGTPRVAAAERQYTVRALNKAGAGEVTITITVEEADVYNPVTVTGTYVDKSHVDVTFANYGGIPSSEDPFNPWADSIGVWYEADQWPDTPDPTSSRLVKVSIQKMKDAGDTYTKRVTVESFPVTADSFYHFAPSVFWHVGTRDSILPFVTGNGDSVLMHDLVPPGNPCSISGEQRTAGSDTAYLYIDNVDAISTDSVASVVIRCSYSSTMSAPFVTKNAPLSEVLANAKDGRYTYTITSSSFTGIRDTVYCSVATIGKNGAESETSSSFFKVGRNVPANPIEQISATTAGPRNVVLQWNNLAFGDSVRILWDTVNIATGPARVDQHMGFRVVPATVARDTVVMPHGDTQYHFGVQVQSNELWSDITDSSRTSATTSSLNAGNTLTNSAAIDTLWFDRNSNTIAVVWQYDSNQDPVVHGATVAPGSVDLRSKAIRIVPTADTSWLRIPGDITFDTTYVVSIWECKPDGPWAIPTQSSTDSVEITSLSWEAVSYFEDDSRIEALDGNAVLWPGSDWPDNLLLEDTLDFVKIGTVPSGFVPVSIGLAFRQHGSPPFNIGIRYDSVPAGYSATDLRMYRLDADSLWQVCADVSIDTQDSIVSTKAQPQEKPFVVMIDAVAPLISISSDTASVPTADTQISDTIGIDDNLGSVTASLLYAKGGAALQVRRVDTLRSLPGNLIATIPAEFVKGENGVRALVVISDGRHVDTINVSRRVRRKESVEVATESNEWVPLRVTAKLDNTAVKPVLEGLMGEDTTWQYDNTRFRVYRWFHNESNVNKSSKWVEYSDDLAERFSLVPGRLMWIKAKESQALDYGGGVTPSLKDTFELTLAPQRWTDFALPWWFPMRIGDILDATGSNAESLVFYRWGKEKGNTRYRTELLYAPNMPGKDYGKRTNELSDDVRLGFSVYNYSGGDITLRIPPVPKAMSTVTDDTTLARRQQRHWAVEIHAWDDQGERRTPIICGYVDRPGRWTGFPVSPSFSRSGVKVLDPQGTELFDHMLQHRMDGGGCRYDLVFYNRSDHTDRIHFDVDRSAGLSEGLHAWVIDPATGIAASVDSGALSVALAPGAEKRRVLAIGGEGYGLFVLDDLRNWNFRLLEVAPNPSRGILNVRFTVPLVGIERISCELFDPSGRIVWQRDVAERRLRPGVNQLVWDGTTPYAGRAASGVYLLRLQGFDHRGKAVKRREQRVVRVP